MTIDELRMSIDEELQRAVGIGSRSLSLWIDSRSHRFNGSGGWQISYSIVIENTARQLSNQPIRVDRLTVEALLISFRTVALPRVREWFGVKGVA